MWNIVPVDSYEGLADNPYIKEIFTYFPDVQGKRVFVKPNLVTPPGAWDIQSTTRVEVLSLVLKELRERGAGKILVGDCGFKDQWDYTMELSEYPKVCEQYGTDLICVQDGENFHKYTLRRFENKSEYLSLYGTKISDYVLESDVVINLPKMKVHSMAGITGAIKNMMGVIQPKGSMHPGGSADILHKRLRDFYYLMKPIVSWTLMDGIEGAEYNEQFGVPKQANVLISGTDMWEVDCMAARVMGIKAENIPYLHYINTHKPMPEVPAEYVTPFELPLWMRK